MTQHLNAATMPEFFGRRFGSKALKVCRQFATSLVMSLR